MRHRRRKPFTAIAVGTTAGLALAAAAVLPMAAAQQHMPVGERVHLTAQDLPPPYATSSVANSSRRISRPEGALPVVPPGFQANLFAGGLAHARWLAVARNGDVFLAEPRAGQITLLRDADGDGVAETRSAWATGLDGVHGLAFRGDFLYAADPGTVWRLPYSAGALTAAGEKEAVSQPFALGAGGGHWTRNLAFSPGGDFLYVAVGSRGNVGEEPEPRATVQRFAVNRIGGLYAQETFASGLRNPVGIAFRPGSEELYVVVNERDGLGDGLVPDYLTHVTAGGFYGWPYAYIGGHPDPDYGAVRPDLVERSIAPDVLFRSHSAPLGLVFYDAAQFPAEFRGDAFVALHGSWNAAQPTGYAVVRVPFEAGRPTGWYETFVSGFWVAGDTRATVWGRPTGLAVAADGSLLVADDVSQSVWRISYQP